MPSYVWDVTVSLIFWHLFHMVRFRHCQHALITRAAWQCAKCVSTSFSVVSSVVWIYHSLTRNRLDLTIRYPLLCSSSTVEPLTNDHPHQRPSSHTTTFRVTDSGFCSCTNPSRATIPLIRPHQCDSEGGRIRGVLL